MNIGPMEYQLDVNSFPGVNKKEIILDRKIGDHNLKCYLGLHASSKLPVLVTGLTGFK